MSDPNRAFVIAIAGPTASGKTTLATALKERYSNSVPVKLFSLDDFYVVRTRWLL